VILSPPAVLLAAARLLLEKGWCQGARALDEHGVPCSPLSPRAVCWDLEGAIQRAAYYILALPAGGTIQAEPAYQTAIAALMSCGDLAFPRYRPRRHRPTPLSAYNDHPERHREEITALLETAFTALENG
jgi:hypothetical protein